MARENSRIKEVEEAVEERVVSEDSSIGVLDRERLVPTGSTLLNLALSDDPYGGFYLGTIVNIVGDSASGKTFLLWTTLAELTYDERFDDHDLIYDEPEVALAFNINKLFGSKVEERVIIESVEKGVQLPSSTVESLHDNLMLVCNQEIPFVYGHDSLDAISDEDELERDIRKGTYGGKKPKLISEILRKVTQKISNTNSLLFIISQTRDNIGVSFGDKKTRSGGKALRFFSTHEIWMAVESHIKRKERDVGINALVKVKKNKLTGKLRTVSFPIYYDYGVDDVVSCIDFLLEEKRWHKDKTKIITKDDFEDVSMPNLIDLIESSEENRKKLIEVTAETWREIEESITTDRPSKYRRD